MKLKDTINMMQSNDFKERFKAEFYQAKIRYDKLDAMTFYWRYIMTQQEFINRVGLKATADMLKTGVLAPVTTAQAILESAMTPRYIVIHNTDNYSAGANARTHAQA